MEVLTWLRPGQCERAVQVNPGFQQVGGVAVARAVNASALGDTRSLARVVIPALR